jgi:hypothetical protein
VMKWNWWNNGWEGLIKRNFKFLLKRSWGKSGTKWVFGKTETIGKTGLRLRLSQFH